MKQVCFLGHREIAVTGALAAVAPKLRTNSGTALAYTYATRQQKEIINLCR